MELKGDTEKPMEKHSHEPSTLLLLYYSIILLVLFSNLIIINLHLTAS